MAFDPKEIERDTVDLNKDPSTYPRGGEVYGSESSHLSGHHLRDSGPEGFEEDFHVETVVTKPPVSERWTANGERPAFHVGQPMISDEKTREDALSYLGSADKNLLHPTHSKNQLSEALKILTQQHREVEALFKEIESSTGIAGFEKKMKIFGSLAEKLNLHAELEEKLLYPLCQSIDPKLVAESLEEHDNIKLMIAKIFRTSMDDTVKLDARIKVLKELIQHHVAEEEAELFPECEVHFYGDRLRSMGSMIQKIVEKVQTQSMRNKSEGSRVLSPKPFAEEAWEN